MKNDTLYIYDNFDIIDENLVNLFFWHKEDSRIMSECFFNEGKIIINLHKYLNNNKIVSLIGNLYSDNSFKIEYILHYNSINDRKNHLISINNKIKYTLRNLEFNNNCSSIFLNNNIIGTVVKYINKYNLKINRNFTICPNIGLNNIGATCYMNSTLQCFCHILKFVNFFKYDQQISSIEKNNKNSLSYSFKILIDNLWPDDYNSSSIDRVKYYSPEDFKSKISKLNPLFEGIAANDAKDLVNFIIMTLHLELNRTDEIPDKNIKFGKIDQGDRELVYKVFDMDFNKKNKSIVSEIFYAINCNSTQCLNCKKIIYNFQTYFFITFPLEEVRLFKKQFWSNQMIQNSNINYKEVNIYECFEYDRKLNLMNGENSMYCNNCKITSNCLMSTNLVTGPEVLIIILNRGKGIEFNVKINFKENLNLYSYIEKKDSGYNYKLIGVITHLGESGMGGHFIAYCLESISGKWYKYNDAFVDEVKNFQKEVIDYAMPYLLFYQKK